MIQCLEVAQYHPVKAVHWRFVSQPCGNISIIFYSSLRSTNPYISGYKRSRFYFYASVLFFHRINTWNEMQTASSRIWTRLIMSKDNIYYDIHCCRLYYFTLCSFPLTHLRNHQVKGLKLKDSKVPLCPGEESEKSKQKKNYWEGEIISDSYANLYYSWLVAHFFFFFIKMNTHLIVSGILYKM